MRIGGFELQSPLLLAPIAGYCDLAFRLVVRGIPGHGGHGAVGLACTDLLCPQALLTQSEKSRWRAATCPSDHPLCMQLYGADADVMAEAARWAEQHGATTIDINMGCPVDKVTKRNGGSKLLCDPGRTVRLARKIVRAVRIPVTAKIRLGWDCQRLITTTLPPALADVGVAAITVHGRTTEQKFRGSVSYAGIAQVVEALRRFPRVPVIGNGDVKTPEDARRMLGATGCAGIMIGRGALKQPWIFRETACYLATGQRPPPLPRWKRARIVQQHFELLCRLRDERYAIRTMIQRMSWYSAALQPWPGLRQKIRAVQSADQFRDFFGAGIEALAAADEHQAAA